MQHLLFWHRGYTNNMFLPLYSFSAEEIFRGEILLFSVNFFDEQKPIYARIKRTTQTDSVTDQGNQADHEYGEPQIEEEDILVTGNDNFEDSIMNQTTKDRDDTDTSTTVETTTTRTEVQYYYYLNDEGERIMTSKQNTALDLQKVVSQWYSAIRNIAIVLSMSVLLYVGIRMLLSTVAQDKAKYKQMLIDWCVGLCLLFFLHYIMAFSVTMVEAFNQIVSQAGRESINSTILNFGNTEVSEEAEDIAEQHASINDQFVLLEDDDGGKITEKLKDVGMEEFIDDSSNPDRILWPTNLMGVLRLRAQVSYGDASFIGYGLCYTILVLFTLYFVFVYLRRVLYMAFLTMIAPLVALTYPIDKISDGQAQGFNKWLKEYIFNLLIQPLHLLLYTILVTSAIELAATNVIYSLVAIGFLIPAEKLMRSLFGFEKATTPGSAAGAVAGATLLNTGLQKLLHKAPGGGKGSGDKGKGSEDDNNSTPRIGFKEPEPEEENSDNINMIDAGGASAADAAYYNPEENPVKRAEREALEEQIADGQINKNELSAQQRALLGMKAEQEEQNQQDNIGQNQQDNIGQQTGKLTGQQNGRKTQQNENGKIKLTKKQQQRKRIAGVAKLTARQAGRKFKRVAPKAIRTVAKVGAGAAAGLTAGAIGATIGIATGDPSNVLSYGGGAALAGGVLGSGLVSTNTPERTKSANQIAREREYWGEEYDKHAAEERIKKLKRNTEMRENLEKNLGLEKTDELYKSGKFDQYLQNEITGYQDIVALENLQEKEKMKFDDALLIFDAYDKYGDINKQKPKDQTDIVDGYTKRFQKGGFNENNAKQKANMLRKMTSKFDTYKKNAQ